MAGPIAAQRPDTVLRKAGPPVRGQITQSSRLGIEVDGENTVEAHEITRVMFGDEPSALRQAKDALADGNLEQAQRALERVRASEVERELVEADWAFAEAECAARLALQTGKGHGPAAKQMLDFIKANKNTFHFYEAAEWLGHLAVAMGRFDSASKYFGQLEKAPWPETQFRGKGPVRRSASITGP